MGRDWIIGVIDDLRRFAALNGMDRLAVALDEAATVAAEEAARHDRPPARDRGPECSVDCSAECGIGHAHPR
ncbi:MAG: hypothetical protein IT542_12105 [Rubellimicrobium sp.]|nr:hypothetical protein [Rubellimicrobium sp.]